MLLNLFLFPIFLTPHPPPMTPEEHVKPPKIEVYGDLCPTVDIVRKEIVKQAKNVNFSTEVALAYANCESTFRADAKNKNSTARGIYQFTNPTWEWIEAEGHQFDYKENIKQFLKYYPIYPGWWEECTIIIYGKK